MMKNILDENKKQNLNDEILENVQCFFFNLLRLQVFGSVSFIFPVAAAIYDDEESDFQCLGWT